jgi:restriction endonuclease S subunit
MVEWKKLGELGTFENIGTDKKIVEGEDIVTLLNYVDVYHHKYIDSSVPQMQVSASSKKIADCTVEKGDIFVTPSSETVDDIGHSSVITETISNAVYSYHIMRYRLFEKNMLLSYYINYSFDTDNVKRQILKKAQGLTRFGLSKDKFASILIPIPSLEEQTRIVGILDTFTSAIDNLKEQIAQRRKQYEHYRDQLLDLEGKEGVEMKIEDFCHLKAGKSIKAEELSTNYDGNNYPCFGGNGIRGYVTFYSHDGEFPIIGRQGALCGCVNWATGKFYATEHAVVATGNKNTTQRFLLHLFQHADLNQYKTQGAQPGLSVAKLNEITFFIPSLQEQQRIVSILDTFEASLANLEAQLKEREKQYEYYRNKLLTFE